MPRRRQDRDLLAAVGARLKVLRQRAGLTQEDVAGSARVAPHTISRIETGDLAPTLTTAAALASAVGVGVAELFDIGAPPTERAREAPAAEELLRLYARLDDADRELVVGLARLAAGRRRVP